MLLPFPLRSALAGLILLAALLAPLPAAAQGLLPASPAPAAEEAPAISPGQAVERLLDVLRDDAARAALIARLEAESAGAPSPAAAEEPPPETVAQRLAAATAEAAGSVADQFSRVGREFGRLRLVVERVTPEEFAANRLEALALLLTIASTILVHSGLGVAVARLARRLTPPIGAGFAPRARGAGAVFAARVATVAAAWLVGYALAALVFGTDGRPSDAQSLYLNAFALFGLFRAALRLLIGPEADFEPVLSALAPGAQRVIYGHLRAVMGTVIQGFLFLVPLAQIWVGFAAARSLRTLIITVAAVMALVAIRGIARTLDQARGDRAGAAQRQHEAGAAMAEGAQSVWRRLWPPLGVAYVLYSWFIAVSQPSLVEEIVLLGTLYSAAGLGLLLVAMKLLRAAPGLRAPLPRGLLAAVPRLGPRADRIAAALGWALAVLLGAIAVVLVVEGWGWADIGAILSQPGVEAALWSLASAALVALGAAAVWAVVASWIDNRLALDLPGRNVSARSRTLLALFRNAFTVAIAILATMITLSQLGIDIAPLLAGAGVIGLAIGFGSQKLVQDIITGIFIQLENAMNEGDVVGVAGITGSVEKITIRSVRLRTLDGAAHVVPFSSVDTVSNLSRDYAYHVAEIGAAYKDKVSDVKAAMEEAFVRLSAEGFDADILEPLEMHGVTALGDSAVNVRARIKTRPGKQWALGRRYTELLKEVMDERGLEIPFPHQQLVLPPGLLPKPERTEKETG
ncbi:MAG: mechanosensitive ion channel [Paracoccaceae bacterium]|nr:mechanosensitive ion channel [Paracoccaceae bacterium]